MTAPPLSKAADLPELPEPALFAPQMITEDAYTADQMHAYVESDRARRQGALTDEDLHELARLNNTKYFYLDFARAVIAADRALSLKGAGD